MLHASIYRYQWNTPAFCVDLVGTACRDLGSHHVDFLDPSPLYSPPGPDFASFGQSSSARGASADPKSAWLESHYPSAKEAIEALLPECVEVYDFLLQVLIVFSRSFSITSAL